MNNSPVSPVLRVINPTGDPVIGAATGVVALPDTGAPWTVNPRFEGLTDSGLRYPLSYAVTANHLSGSPKALHVTVTGEFATGETFMHVISAAETPHEPLAIPYVKQLLQAKLRLRGHAHRSGVDWKFDKTIKLAQDNAVPAYVTSNFVIVHQTIELAENVEALLTLRHNHQEQGVRWTLTLSDNGRNLFDDASDPDYTQFEEIKFLSPTTGQAADQVYTEYDMNAVAKTGAWKLKDAVKKPPYAAKETQNGAELTLFQEGFPACPTGGRYAAISTLGDSTSITGSAATSHLPNSDIALTIQGGKREIWEGSFGAISQELTDEPLLLQWADPTHYSDMIVGWPVPADPKAVFANPHRGRYERYADSYIKPEVASRRNGRDTSYTTFVESGGTWGSERSKKQLHNYRDYGSSEWGDGLERGDHYDLCANFMRQWFCDGDPRYAYQADKGGRVIAANGYFLSDNPRNGGFSYEKGEHGSFQRPTASHEWPEALMWRWHMHLCPVAHKLLNNYASTVLPSRNFSGTDVPEDWTHGSLKDPRDWGARDQPPYYGEVQGGGNGWFGDYGLRMVGRALDASVKLQVTMGIDQRRIVDSLLTRMSEIEVDIWGAQGATASRSERVIGKDDYEQTWIGAHGWRGVGNALHYVAPDHHAARASYMRSVNFISRCIRYLVSDIPARPASAYNQHGPVQVWRQGFDNEGYQYVLNWLENPQASELPSVLALFRDVQLQSRYPQKFIDRGIQILEGLGEASEITTQDVSEIAATSRYLLKMERYPATPHCSVVADLMAQAAILHKGMGLDVVALELINTALYHMSDGVAAISYEDPTMDPDDNGYRVARYVGSEGKVAGQLLDTRWVHILFHMMDPVAVNKPPSMHLTIIDRDVNASIPEEHIASFGEAIDFDEPECTPPDFD